jgi:tryptophan synthase alpha chain
MSRLSEIFKANRKCFIPFITAGYPDLDSTRRLVLEFAQAGAQIVELGIPFSDPVADGPVIQRSSYAALQHGYSIADYIDLVRQIRRDSDVGLIFMSYVNPLLKFGLKRLDGDARAAGLDGILISDLTPEAYEGLGCRLDLDTVFLAAPTSSDSRLAKICAVSRGFVYLVARTGVTGKRTDLETNLSGVVARVRECTALPVAVGFGITSKADVEKVWQYADGAIVGSAIVKFMQDNESSPELVRSTGEYVSTFLKG